MGKFSGFFDNFASGVLGPKGNLADWQHSSRLYITDNQKHAPKLKFLYHVTFYLTSGAKSVIPQVDSHTHEIGMLVKSCDLPKYSSNVETKKKYNRTKHIQTSLTYNPINITFHDDNFGATTALLEAYYKYYYADGYHGLSSGAYGNRFTGDTTYAGEGSNTYKFGLDNNTPSVPFFDRIEIAVMARKSYTRYTLVNPIVSDWQHDSVDNSDGSGTMQNSITVNYDSVIYDRGRVEAGENGDPTGFGRADHYDTTPSPNSLLGGGRLGFDDALGAGLDLYEYITEGKNFNNPFEAIIAGANLIGNVRDLDASSLRQGGLELVRDTLGEISGFDVSGVPLTLFPKNSGTGSSKDVAIATAAIAGLSVVAGSFNTPSTSTGDVNPQNIDDARFQNYLKNYQSSGGTGGINGARASFDALSTSDKEQFD